MMRWSGWPTLLVGAFPSVFLPIQHSFMERLACMRMYMRKAGSRLQPPPPRSCRPCQLTRTHSHLPAPVLLSRSHPSHPPPHTPLRALQRRR